MVIPIGQEARAVVVQRGMYHHLLFMDYILKPV
jgi:hypothetical protein